MPKPGPFDALGEGLKSLIGEAVRQGKGELTSVIDGLGEAMAVPKALAVLVSHSDRFAVWQLLTEPSVLVAIHTPEHGDPFVAAAVVRKDVEELAGDLMNAVRDAARKEGVG